jgi:hypothetical protein
MSAPDQIKPAIRGDSRAGEQQESRPRSEGLSRRAFLGVGSASLATAALASLTANAPERADTEAAERDHSVSNPGPENKALLEENPNSNFPLRTDKPSFALRSPTSCASVLQ